MPKFNFVPNETGIYHFKILTESGVIIEKIITTNFSMTPIPLRQFDWSAIYDNYEPNCPIGHGATEQEAIQDLLDQTEE